MSSVNLFAVEVIAHRGAAGYAPENTLAAVKKATELNSDYIEVDVHVSKDGHVIVIHDTSVDRTTNGEGRVNDLTLKQLKKLDAGSWFSKDFKNEKVPTLEEVIQVWDRKYAICRLKLPIEDCFALIQDKNEITAIIEEEKIPHGLVEEVESGWKILTFDMILPFELVGFLAVVASELAKIQVSIFAISAFSTDHILVKETDLSKTIVQLKALGCTIEYL